MATLLLKKSYQLSNLKEVVFKDLWGSRGVFTTMRMVGKPPKFLLFKPHIESLLKEVPRDTKILTVIDGHQLTLSWLGSVLGHKVIPLGVDRFGQTGNIKELLTEFAIDSVNITNLGLKLV